MSNDVIGECMEFIFLPEFRCRFFIIIRILCNILSNFFGGQTAVHVVSGWIQNVVLGNNRDSFIFQRNLQMIVKPYFVNFFGIEFRKMMI